MLTPATPPGHAAPKSQVVMRPGSHVTSAASPELLPVQGAMGGVLPRKPGGAHASAPVGGPTLRAVQLKSELQRTSTVKSSLFTALLNLMEAAVDQSWMTVPFLLNRNWGTPSAQPPGFRVWEASRRISSPDETTPSRSVSSMKKFTVNPFVPSAWLQLLPPPVQTSGGEGVAPPAQSALPFGQL